MGEIKEPQREQVENEKLRLMVFKSAMELGRKVDEHLLEMYGFPKDKYTFMVPLKENFFEDGHLKVEIGTTVRSMDMFLLTDIGNYSLEYNMHGFTNHTSPNDLMMQLKDGIGACNSHARNINIIMPLLYAGRQHRRNTRENLLCGQNLRELDSIRHVKSFITFDAHDPGVEHAVHNIEFDNFYATNVVLEDFISDLSTEQLENLVFVAPDGGAVGRTNVYLNSFNSPLFLSLLTVFIRKGITIYISNPQIAPAKNIAGAGIYCVVITSAPPFTSGIFIALFIALPIIGPIIIGIKTLKIILTPCNLPVCSTGV